MFAVAHGSGNHPGCVKTLLVLPFSPDSAGELMRLFVEEADCGQWTLLLECLDDFIDESNPVRVIDVFDDALDLGEREAVHLRLSEPCAVGPTASNQKPGTISRTCGCWVGFALDHKTIANFAMAWRFARYVRASRNPKLKEEMDKLAEKQMLASLDQQISLTDPDSRSMATSGRGSGDCRLQRAGRRGHRASSARDA
jgi:hypothetical protein